MKIYFKVYCNEHGEELVKTDDELDAEYNCTIEVKPCSQCMLESYEKGIESLLSKGYARNEGEL